MTKQEPIYLDHAAATPLDKRVLSAMEPYFIDRFYNPSSPYAPAVAVRRDIEMARHSLARSVGAKPADVVITAGATESINLAMSAAGDGEIITASIEHPAVLEAARRRGGRVLAVGRSGVIDSATIATEISPNTQLVSVALANNELGTIQPIKSISQLIQQERQRRIRYGERRPIWLHCDASQGVGQIDISVARLGVDLLTLNAAKCYGPKQVGLLWRASQVELQPLVVGGGQEAGLRSGTENVPGIIGFATALEIATTSRSSEARRLSVLRDSLQRQLLEAFPGMVLNGHRKKRLPGHLHVSLAGIDAERLVFMLEAKGVYVATGSACAANQGTRSHVLEAIGLEAAVADGSLRLSLGRQNDQASIDRAAGLIIEAIDREQRRVRR